MNHFVVQPVFKKKDKEVAKKKREDGNAAYTKKWYRQAMMMYSVAAVKAPVGDESLAYSIANRSACLYYLGEIKLCIADINLALVCGYPPQLHYKLYERLAKCYILLNDKEGAIKAAVTSKKTLEKNKSKFDQEKYKSAMKSLMKLGALVNNPNDGLLDNIEVVEDPVVPVPKVAWKPQKKMRELSSLLRVDFKPELGRHVKAEKEVKPGDTLLVEEPFASVLYNDKQGNTCDFCFKRLKAVVPCSQCAGIGFCSKECREKALSTYHKYECKYLDLLQGLGCSALVRLALRIITLHPLDYFKKMRTDLNVDTKSTDVKQPYLAVFNLVGLDDQRWPEDTFARTMMSVALLKILKEARYFPDKADAETFTDDEIFIGSLIHRHLSILQFNAHEVYQLLRTDQTKIKPCKNNLIGLAVYPKASFFNHSCHPNTSRLKILT